MSAVASLASVATRLSRGCVLRRSDPSPVARRLSARRARAPLPRDDRRFYSRVVVGRLARRVAPRATAGGRARASRAAPSSAPPGVSVRRRDGAEAAAARRGARARVDISLPQKRNRPPLSRRIQRHFSFPKPCLFLMSVAARSPLSTPPPQIRAGEDETRFRGPPAPRDGDGGRARRRRRTSSKKVSPRSSSTTPRRVLPRDHVRSVWNEISPAGKKSHQ